MTAGQLAALIAACFFAVGVCVAGYVLIKLARLCSAATALLNGYAAGAQEVIQRAQDVVTRADQQLARTAAVSDSVDAVTASMTELSDQVSEVAGTARLISSGLNSTVLRFAAAGYGLRRAIRMRSASSAPIEVRRLDDRAVR